MKNSTFIVILVMTLAQFIATGAAAYEVVVVSNGGAVTGKVTFSGTDPAPQVYAINKNTDVCGDTQEIDYVKVNNGALTDVVVYLDKVKSGKPFSNGDGHIDQKGCVFRPFLQVMTNAKNLEVLNSDPIPHNIHTFELIGTKKRTAFNVNLPDQGAVLKKKVKLRRGTAMKIECDQHAFMHGFVFVAKNPYYAVVAEDGTFMIDVVPPGDYTVKAWHGTLGEQAATVNVASDGAATVDFEFKGK